MFIFIFTTIATLNLLGSELSTTNFTEKRNIYSMAKKTSFDEMRSLFYEDYMAKKFSCETSLLALTKDLKGIDTNDIIFSYHPQFSLVKSDFSIPNGALKIDYTNKLIVLDKKSLHSETFLKFSNKIHPNIPDALIFRDTVQNKELGLTSTEFVYESGEFSNNVHANIRLKSNDSFIIEQVYTKGNSAHGVKQLIVKRLLSDNMDYDLANETVNNQYSLIDARFGYPSHRGMVAVTPNVISYTVCTTK